MYQIQTITTDALQVQNFTLADGTQLTITFYFRPRQYGWFINNLTYGSFLLNGLRMTNSPNMLRQFKNQIPFGLACITNGLREPTQQADFASGAAKLYILSSSEVEAYEEFVLNG